jgi:hypothetical protein
MEWICSFPHRSCDSPCNEPPVPFRERIRCSLSGSVRLHEPVAQVATSRQMLRTSSRESTPGFFREHVILA